MAGPRGRNKRRPQQKNYIRRNDRIRVSEVRLIGADGKQVGLVPTEKALQMAKAAGLDLVEVSASTRPPVCRILDFGKYQYELSKKNKDSKSTQQKTKEVKFRLTIGEHDYMTKLRNAERFLFKGNKVKLTLSFRGREMAHMDLGRENLLQTIKDLEHIAHADQSEPRKVGRQLTVTVTPHPANQRKLKFTKPDEEIEEDLHDDDDEEEIAEEETTS